MIQANIPETKSEITKLIGYALAGEKVMIAINERPLIELKMIPKNKPKKYGDRKELFGLLRDEIKIYEKDLTLPNEVVNSFYSSDIEHANTS